MARAEPVTVDQLLEDLKTVVADAEALLKATANQAGEKVQEARARAAESLLAARERLDEVKDSAFQHARDAAKSGDDYVRTNPWQAVGIAAGIGVIIGMMMRRS
jgi:ElaB/YqjD/DUF883 family membrane-anchored ribosome-binding protein